MEKTLAQLMFVVSTQNLWTKRNDSSKPKKNKFSQNPTLVQKLNQNLTLQLRSECTPRQKKQRLTLQSILFVAYRITPQKLSWYFLLNMASFWVSMLNFRGCIHAIRFLGKVALCHFEGLWGCRMSQDSSLHPKCSTPEQKLCRLPF